MILVTAKASPKDVVAGLDAGGDDYLTKPIDHGALVARVRAMLRIKALHDEVQALNQGLEAKVRDQVEELERVGRLRRFLAPQLAQAIVSAGDDKMLENHRREVVAVFCDLRGFTSFSETAEPEDIMAVLAEYHGAVGPLIRKYEGTLDRFTGDGMMVFFNDPLPCPDAPERAARLAIEMRDAVAALAPSWKRRGHVLGVRHRHGPGLRHPGAYRLRGPLRLHGDRRRHQPRRPAMRGRRRRPDPDQRPAGCIGGRYGRGRRAR